MVCPLGCKLCPKNVEFLGWEFVGVWDCKVPPEMIGYQGSVEQYRPCLGKSKLMQANEVYWLTDTTPHEALPIASGAQRQYVRLVTNRVSVWYEQHSTKNRLGIKPDARIISTNKFTETTHIDTSHAHDREI